MNLTWHIVKKDLRALKWPLALWLLLIVAKLGVGVAMLTATGSVNADWFANWFVRMDIFSKVLAGLECVSFVLVAAVIHEDLLIGTTAFWMTRPISGGRLLRAKLLGIGLVFWVMPVLVTLPWWLGCGYGMREIAWAALETVVVQAVCVLLGLLWSVVTDGFARFLLWTLVLLFAIPTVAGVIGLHISNLAVKPTADLLLTRVWVVIAIAVLAILAVTIHQFLTRQTWRSVMMICSAIGLIVAAGFWWPWDLQLKAKWNDYLAERAEHVVRLKPEPTGLKFAIESLELKSRPDAPNDRPNRIELKFSVTGIPENQVLTASWANSATLRWPDGSIEHSGVGIRHDDDSFRRSFWQTLGLPVQSNEREGRQAFTCITFLPVDTVARLQAESPALTLKPIFQLLKFDSATKFPLQAGARTMMESVGERVAYVESMDGQILVTYIRSRPDLLVDQVANRGMLIGKTYSRFALVNQVARKFSFGVQRWLTTSRVASVSISLQIVGYGGSRPAGRKAALPEEWLRNAELTRGTFTEEARFIHEMKVDSFPVESPKP